MWREIGGDLEDEEAFKAKNSTGRLVKTSDLPGGREKNIASSFTLEVSGGDARESDFVGNKMKCSITIKYF